MPETGRAAPTKSMAKRATTFPTVPIAQVPLPVESAEASAYRPIVLVVDDEPAVADTLAEILIRNGYAAMAAYDEESALETAALVPPDLLIADDLLPYQMSGVDLAIAVKSESPDCKIILLSGRQSTANLLSSAKRAVHQISLLSKPVHPADLLLKVTATLNRAKPAVGLDS
jgi:DNA-binding response OmpR family regulator